MKHFCVSGSKESCWNDFFKPASYVTSFTSQGAVTCCLHTSSNVLVPERLALCVSGGLVKPTQFGRTEKKHRDAFGVTDGEPRIKEPCGCSCVWEPAQHLKSQAPLLLTAGRPPEKGRSYFRWQPSGRLSGSLSGVECRLPTVTPSGGYKGRDRRPSWRQRGDTQQMIRVSEGVEVPQISTETFL